MNGSMCTHTEEAKVTHIHQPFHLSAPQNVLLLVHVDREVLVLALLDGIGPGGDGPHFVELTTKRNKRDIRNIKQKKEHSKANWLINLRTVCVSCLLSDLLLPLEAVCVQLLTITRHLSHGTAAFCCILLHPRLFKSDRSIKCKLHIDVKFRFERTLACLSLLLAPSQKACFRCCDLRRSPLYNWIILKDTAMVHLQYSPLR